jgi:hypothetical protein
LWGRCCGVLVRVCSALEIYFICGAHARGHYWCASHPPSLVVCQPAVLYAPTTGGREGGFLMSAAGLGFGSAGTRGAHRPHPRTG